MYTTVIQQYIYIIYNSIILCENIDLLILLHVSSQTPPNSSRVRAASLSFPRPDVWPSSQTGPGGPTVVAAVEITSKSLGMGRKDA